MPCDRHSGSREGKDSAFQGAVDDLRINSNVYDFEPFGVLVTTATSRPDRPAIRSGDGNASTRVPIPTASARSRQDAVAAVSRSTCDPDDTGTMPVPLTTDGTRCVSSRTLIATAITVGSLAGALALADPGRSDAPTGLATPTPTADASTPTDRRRRRRRPRRRPATNLRPNRERDRTNHRPRRRRRWPRNRLRSPSPSAFPTAPSNSTPNSHGGADTQIATGPVAAAWLARATPSVRHDVADNLDTTPDELTEQFLDDPAAFLSTDGMVGYIEPAAVRDERLAHGARRRQTWRSPRCPPTSSRCTRCRRRPRSSTSTSTATRCRTSTGTAAYSIGPFTNQPTTSTATPSAFSDHRAGTHLRDLAARRRRLRPVRHRRHHRGPGIDGLRRTSPTDTTFGVRVVITSSDWYAAANGGTRIGGIALLNVFTSSTDHASYVFSSNLGSAATPSTSPTPHRTRPATRSRSATTARRRPSYYSGHGSWGPIMGTPYSRAVTQWSNGQYTGRQQHRGRPRRDRRTRRVPSRRPRRHRPPARPSCRSATRSGFIGVGGDVDVFRFTPTGGSTRVTVTTPPPATNLLARLTVRDACGRRW